MPSDTTAVRDELAKMMGWEYENPAWVLRARGNKRLWDQHPIPDTLDGAAACMPEGWLWVKGGAPSQWNAAKAGDCWADGVYIPDTGNEKLDRFTLALAARKGGGR